MMMTMMLFSFVLFALLAQAIEVVDELGVHYDYYLVVVYGIEEVVVLLRTIADHVDELDVNYDYYLLSVCGVDELVKVLCTIADYVRPPPPHDQDQKFHQAISHAQGRLFAAGDAVAPAKETRTPRRGDGGPCGGGGAPGRLPPVCRGCSAKRGAGAKFSR